ncbi:MAG: hypothetical protein ABIF71_05575 [Planctomycetota bacterium]
MIGVLLVLALLAGGGYWLWQKQARGEISISLNNAFQTERRVTWNEFVAMLNQCNEKGTVVVQAELYPSGTVPVTECALHEGAQVLAGAVGDLHRLGAVGGVLDREFGFGAALRPCGQVGVGLEIKEDLRRLGLAEDRAGGEGQGEGYRVRDTHVFSPGHTIHPWVGSRRSQVAGRIAEGLQF